MAAADSAETRSRYSTAARRGLPRQLVSQASRLLPDSLAAVAHAVFVRRTRRMLSDRTEVVVAAEQPQVRTVSLRMDAAESSTSAGKSSVAAQLHCRVDTGAAELWVGSLVIRPALRERGLGRGMVEAVEEFAARVGVPKIKVYPLPQAHGFWRRLGYQPDAVTSRVLVKYLPGSF